MAYNLQNTINFTATFIQYSPQTAGLGQEPAVSIASMVRSTLLAAPITWAFNRGENSSVTTNTTDQDYPLTIGDLGFIEKVSLTDGDGNIWELKDVLNNAALAVSADSARPSAVSVFQATPYTDAKLRFNFVPDQAYKVNIVYQKCVSLLGPYFITSVAPTIAVPTTATYDGIFDVVSFPVGSVASVTGFKANAGNNGLFVVVSATPTQLILQNPNSVAETITAYVSNFNWAPLPDSFIYVYNNLYLSEVMAMVDDPRAAQYRQRGIAGFLSKAEGLTEMQKNAFVQLWMARGVEASAVSQRAQVGNIGRGV